MIVEVLAEAACLDLARQIAVGGGHDLAAEEERLRVPEALEGARLEDAQELHLDRRVGVADLVQEDRPEGLAGLEPAGAVLERAREGAAAVAEELRLDEGGREGGEVERVEEVAESRREALRARVEGDVAREADGARDHLLARPRRADDQRGDVVHPLVERPPVAAHVVREDRLPDGGAQARRTWKRLANRWPGSCRPGNGT